MTIAPGHRDGEVDRRRVKALQEAVVILRLRDEVRSERRIAALVHDVVAGHLRMLGQLPCEVAVVAIRGEARHVPRVAAVHGTVRGLKPHHPILAEDVQQALHLLEGGHALQVVQVDVDGNVGQTPVTLDIAPAREQRALPAVDRRRAESRDAEPGVVDAEQEGLLAVQDEAALAGRRRRIVTLEGHPGLSERARRARRRGHHDRRHNDNPRSHPRLARRPDGHPGSLDIENVGPSFRIDARRRRDLARAPSVRTTRIVFCTRCAEAGSRVRCAPDAPS
jgi:hypothetical protein